MARTLKSLHTTHHRLAAECHELSNMLCRKGNVRDSYMLKEINDKMNMIEYQTKVINDFINIQKKAEAENFDLGEEINSSVSSYYVNFIIDLKLDIEDDGSYYFADKKCFEFFENWKKLCRLYKEHFEKMDLPKGIDLEMYNFAMETSE